MSDNKAIEFDTDGKGELKPVFIGKIEIRKFDAESIVRAAHRADDALTAQKSTLGEYYELFIGLMIKLFVEARDDVSVPAEDVHDEALSQFEGQIEAARVRLIENGVYSSISVKSKTHEQYMTNLRRVCRLRLDLAEVDGAGQSVFARAGSLASAAKKAEDAITAREAEERAEKRLQRMVDKGEVNSIEEAREKLAGPQLTPEGVKAAESTTRHADKGNPLSGLSLSVRKRMEAILEVMVEIDNSGHEKAKQELGNLIDKQMEYLLGEKGRLNAIVDFNKLREAAEKEAA